MREFSSPATQEAPRRGNLTDDVVANARDYPDAAVLAVRGQAGWQDVSAADFHAQVRDVAKGLVASGIQPRDRVALLSRTRWEWTVLDYAIWYAGAVSVPVYETSSAQQVMHILADSGARAVIVETPEHVARIAESRTDLPELREVWSIDDGALAALTDAGRGVSDADIEARRTTVTPLDLATLVYTSGTTGLPKGCMLTHGNFMVEVGVAVDELDRLFRGESSSTLLFLPLAHVFARIIQIGSVKARVRLGHHADVRTLPKTLGEFQPTFVLAVPRVFEKLFNTASQTAAADGKGRIFERAAETAIAWSRAKEAGRVPVRISARHAAYDKLVYPRLRDALGGRCEYAISGGAPLGDRLGHFYRGIGVTVLEGYGLTETTAALTVNLPDAHRVGSVGRPLPGTSVRVSDDGELLFRGGQVFTGYWRNDEATAEVLEPADLGGWLHTGDVGEVDAEGFVRITGRKKELLVTAGGKNVAPALLEERLRAHPLISQCLVVGDGQPYVAALVTIDADALEAWCEKHGRSGKLTDLVEDPELVAEVQRAVDATNQAVSQAESIRRFQILAEDWTEEGGQLTPSLKLKRNVVMREFRHEVAALYER